jgi:iron complex outermembrane receptor protein
MIHHPSFFSCRFDRTLLTCAAAISLAVFPAQAEPTHLLSLDLEELGAIKIDTVFAASKSTEKVTDAPASVTIVTREDILRFGYRTLADIVRATRSFDVTYDRNYSYTGSRGFNRIGDYGSHILLLVDGHRMNDPLYDTTAVGTEGLLDVDLIERVEFIRGPASALYGSNAVAAVINVVTRSGASVNGVEASSSAGSFGTYSERLTIGKRLPCGVEYLFSGTNYASAGPARLYYKEFDTPETNHGLALNEDGDRFWSTLGKISYGDFVLQAAYVTRDKSVPTGSFGSVFDAPNSTVDSRGYVELRYAHESANGWSLSGRAFYDVEDYHELATYAEATGLVLNDDSGRARWWGAEANASRTFFNCFRFTLGSELRDSTDLRQRTYDESPYFSYEDLSNKQTIFGAYADGRWEITKSLSLTGGARWDDNYRFGSRVNPHGALIWKPLEGTTVKLLFGEAYPAPNVYQLEYDAFGVVPNPNLKPESIRTYEAVLEQYWAAHWRGTVSLFRNEISGLIEDVDVGNGNVSPTNAGNATVNGAELEVEGKWDNGWLVRASYTRQDAESGHPSQKLVNSPEDMLKAQVSIPLLRDKIYASCELLYASDRLTLTRQRTDDMLLVNATLFSRELVRGLEFSASIYNLFDQKYRTPGGEEHVQDTLQQDGRTFRLKLTYRF